jgi:hypothetical protein
MEAKQRTQRELRCFRSSCRARRNFSEGWDASTNSALKAALMTRSAHPDASTNSALKAALMTRSAHPDASTNSALKAALMTRSAHPELVEG